jgi:hypothetical protein
MGERRNQEVFQETTGRADVVSDGAAAARVTRAEVFTYEETPYGWVLKADGVRVLDLHTSIRNALVLPMLVARLHTGPQDAPTRRPIVKAGSVVHLHPTKCRHDRLPGCLAIVTQVEEKGIVGYVTLPGEGGMHGSTASFTAKWDEFTPTGGVVKLKPDTECEEPNDTEEHDDAEA